MDLLRVMILEDRLSDQELVKRQVKKYKPNTLFLVASDKTTFLEKIDWFLPDLILADFNLPDYTGLDALVHVKTNKPFIPFIFVTGGLHPGDPLSESILAQADGSLYKDDMSQLHQLIAEVMENIKTKISESEEKLRKKSERKVKVLKMIALIQSTEDGEKRRELMELLEELSPDIIND